MSHIGNSLVSNNLTIRGQSLGMNPNVMNLIDLLKIEEIGLVTRTTTGKIMEWPG